MATTTSRLALTQPAGTDPPSELRTAITSNAATLDNSVLCTTGTLASRPSAGIAGREYYATDQGLFYKDNGTTWQALNLGALTSASAQKTGITVTVTPTKAALDTLVFDPGSNLDLVTNHRYVVPVAGYYSVQAYGLVISTASAQSYTAAAFKNGVSGISATFTYSTASSQTLTSLAAGVMSCAANDHIEVWVSASTTLTSAVASLTVVRVG